MRVMLCNVCTKMGCDLRVPAYGSNASRPGWLAHYGGLSRSRGHCVCSSGGLVGHGRADSAGCIHLSVEAYVCGVAYGYALGGGVHRYAWDRIGMHDGLVVG